MSRNEELEDRFRLMADIAPVMLWMAGTDKLCYYFNKRWLDFTGRSLDQEVGNGWADGVHPEDFDRCLEGYSISFDMRQQFRMEYRLRRKDGCYRWILDTGTPMYDRDGEFTGYIGSCIDITEQRDIADKLEVTVQKRTTELAEANKELASARDLALQASRLKSQFLANMSHEIRTPMNAVIGLLDLLATTELNSEQHELASLASVSASALMDIINDVLDFSKIEAGKMRVEMTVFDLEELVETVCMMMADLARSKKLSLNAIIQPNIPRAVLGDPVRLRQILVNLLSNAIKFTSQGQVVLEVTFGEPPGRFQFTVSDTGCGISREQMIHLFEPFVQLDGSITRRHGGTGLGLSICKSLVDMLGGRIDVESEEGKGSRFWFELPLEPVSEKLLEPEAHSASGKGSAKGHDKDSRATRILIVEDNPLNQKVIEAQLKKLGYSSDIVANGREAIEAMTDNKYAAILMDCQMPDMDGLTAAKTIRTTEKVSGRHIPIIALTAYALPGDDELCLASGMDDYLSKPIDLKILRDKLAAWIRIAAPVKD